MYGIDEFADMIEFQSSRSLRTATCGYYRLLGEFAISILAVLADRDQCPENVNNPHSISILAVLADRDDGCRPQSGAFRNISILAVLADRDFNGGYKAWYMQGISILAVLADRDIFCAFRPDLGGVFQSSRSLRTATSQS